MFAVAKNPYRPPASYTLGDLKKALTRTGGAPIRDTAGRFVVGGSKRPATMNGLARADLLAWMRKHLSTEESAAVVSAAWDVCIERHARKKRSKR